MYVVDGKISFHWLFTEWKSGHFWLSYRQKCRKWPREWLEKQGVCLLGGAFIGEFTVYVPFSVFPPCIILWYHFNFQLAQYIHPIIIYTINPLKRFPSNGGVSSHRVLGGCSAARWALGHCSETTRGISGIIWCWCIYNIPDTGGLSVTVKLVTYFYSLFYSLHQ